MRLDLFIAQKENLTRTRASNLIKLGGVSVNGKVVDKVSFEIKDEDDIQVVDLIEFDSLGGIKLNHALEYFNISNFSICADIGASNGGFTSCLLSKGAKKVYAVDVGECAFSEELKKDSRVVVMDNTNARFLAKKDFPEEIDFLVCDVSFISIKNFPQVFYNLLCNNGRGVILVKPQFEVGKKFLTKSGIVKDAKAREKALSEVQEVFKNTGFDIKGITEIPQKFKNKNVEYLMYIIKKFA